MRIITRGIVLLLSVAMGTDPDIALGQVRTPQAAEGTRLQIEYTVDYERRQIPATVVKTPFFTPERTRSTPKKATPAVTEAPTPSDTEGGA